MKYVFEAIKNKFHESATLKRLCREIYLEVGEGDDRPQRALPCLRVRKLSGERIPADNRTIEKLEIEFLVQSKCETAHAVDSIIDMVEQVKNHFHERLIVHPLFKTVEMFLANDPQPRLFDATYEAELIFELTIAWQDEPALLRYT